MTMSPTRQLINQLEQLADRQDDLQARLLDSLKAYADASEANIEAIERHMEQNALSRSSVIVEAACLLTERETGHNVAARLEMAYRNGGMLQ